jgi:DNA-3-methyladenine glycosylase II
MEYLEHLSKDRKLKKLVADHAPLSISKRKDIHFYLIASIMSQQLSAKVADTIQKRFLTLYGDHIPPPEEILKTSLETLRGIGLSNAKARYVHNVAQFAVEQGMDHKRLGKMDNEEVIAYLTQIKGVGRWTAEMLLMFALGREDIFAIDDWGVQNAMIHIYKLDRADKKVFRENLLRISAKWSPYRSYACMHLWRWKDNKPAVELKTAPAAVKTTKAARAAKSASAATKRVKKK